MQKKTHLVLTLIIALCITTGISAQDTAEKTEKAKVQKQDRQKNKAAQRHKERVAKRIKRDFVAVELTADQEKKIAGLIDEHFESIQEIQKKVDQIIGKEDKKVVSAASRKAREEGKTWPESMKIAYEEIGLSEENQEKLKGLNKERNQLLKKISDEVVATLSEEQKAAHQAAQKGKKGKGKKGKQ